MNGAIVFLLAFLGFLVLVVVLAVRAAQRSAGTGALNGPMKQLARDLGLPEDGPLAVEREGRAVTAKYILGGKNTPPTLRITTTVDEVRDAAAASAYREAARSHVALRPALVLRRENGMDRFGKRLGLNREVQTGDAAFDAAVYIETDSPEEDVQRTLADEALRTAVRGLLDGGITRVELDPTGLAAVCIVRGRVDAGTFEQTAALLSQAATGLPLFTAGQVTRAQNQVGPVLGMVAVFALWPFTLVFMGRAPLGSGAALVGLGGGLGLWAVIVLVLGRVLRGRSDSLRRISLLALPCLFCVPTATYGAVVWTNRELDTSPAVDHPTTVQRLWSSRSKSTTYYHLDVASWRPGETTQTLSVSPAFYTRAKQGMGIVVATHAGKLGWEWVDTFRLTPREGAKP